MLATNNVRDTQRVPPIHRGDVWQARLTRTPCINREIYVVRRFGRSLCLTRHRRSTLCRERTCPPDYLARFAHCPRLGLAHSSPFPPSPPPCRSLFLSLSFSRLWWRHRRLAALNLTPLLATALLRREWLLSFPTSNTIRHWERDSAARWSRWSLLSLSFSFSCRLISLPPRVQTQTPRRRSFVFFSPLFSLRRWNFLVNVEVSWWSVMIVRNLVYLGYSGLH